MINLYYPLQLEAFIWDTKMLNFLAEILQGDCQLVLRWRVLNILHFIPNCLIT